MRATAIALLLAALPTAATAQYRAPDLAAQKAALARFAMLDGTWVGTATIAGQDGKPRKLRHTERVGPLLGGTIRLIEGRSYEADGRDAGFNAFAVISPDENGGFTFRAYAQGHAQTVPIEATGDGFAWQRVVGPVTLSYRAVVKDGHWHEEGTMTRAGAAPVTTIVLDLHRTGATDWPAAGAVAPQ